MIIIIFYHDYCHCLFRLSSFFSSSTPLFYLKLRLLAPQQLPPSSHGCFQVVSHLRWPFGLLCEGISTFCLLSDYFCSYSQGLGLSLRLSARTCVRSSQSSTKWVESTLCQDPSTWATTTFLAMQIHNRSIITTKTTSYSIMRLSCL